MGALMCSVERTTRWSSISEKKVGCCTCRRREVIYHVGFGGKRSLDIASLGVASFLRYPLSSCKDFVYFV